MSNHRSMLYLTLYTDSQIHKHSLHAAMRYPATMLCSICEKALFPPKLTASFEEFSISGPMSEKYTQSHSKSTGQMLLLSSRVHMDEWNILQHVQQAERSESVRREGTVWR